MCKITLYSANIMVIVYINECPARSFILLILMSNIFLRYYNYYTVDAAGAVIKFYMRAIPIFHRYILNAAPVRHVFNYGKL